jgi:hypothetical protein
MSSAGPGGGCLAPIWISWGLVAAFLIGLLAFAGVAAGLAQLLVWWDTRKRNRSK